MPVYEYLCYACNHRSEEIFSYSDKPIYIRCKHCDVGLARYMPSTFFGLVIPEERKKMKAAGIIPKEPGLVKQAKENKAYIKEKKRKEIRKAVEQAVVECTPGLSE